MADEPTTAIEETDQDQEQVSDSVQDVLVEEVSIDGMCGVY